MMVIAFFFFLAAVAGFLLIPHRLFGNVPWLTKRLPTLDREWTRRVQMMAFGSLMVAFFALRIIPIVIILLLLAAAVLLTSYWKERMDDGEVGDLSEDMAADYSHIQGTNRGAQMDEKLACDVLGVSKEASIAEIETAHRKLISQIHPDKGGTDYLAAQINEARSFLVRLKQDS